MNRFLAAAAAVLLAFAGAAGAQNWPVKPVRLVVGFAAGGTTDVVARIVAQRLGELGVDLVGNTPEEFAAFLRSEIVRYARVIREAGIKAE